MNEFIPVNMPSVGPLEARYPQECIDSGWISSEGPFVARFEQAVAEATGRQFAVAVSSGSAALDVAVAALGLGEGDEVIMPAFTIISCASAIIRAGATPVLVDSDPQTWTMDVSQVEAKINSRTRAIMPVHIYGLPVDMQALLDISGRHGLAVIEDAAEAIGQTCHGKACGGFGDVSTFSFYANKHVTCGEGGMVLTDDANLAEQARSLRNLCFKAEQRFVHDRLGWNFRMTNMQAAIGLAQMERLQEHVSFKRRMGARYAQELSGIESLTLPIEETPYASNDYWVYGLLLDREYGRSARDVMRDLGDLGVGTRPFFWPMHQQPVFQRIGLFGDESYAVSEHLSTHGFYIPSGLGLSESQLGEVTTRVRKVLS